MSAKFSFETRHWRSIRIAERFCAKASETHAISLTENAAERVVRMRKHGEDGQQLIPHEAGYHFALGLASESQLGEVSIWTTSEEADIAESIFHPLVDTLVKILCGEENMHDLDFGDSMRSSDEPGAPSPCSGETLQYLFSSVNKVKRVIFGPVCIGEDLTQAFACPENPANKSGLSIHFANSNIINYSLMGQSLSNIPFLRKLMIWPKHGHNVVPLIQGLSAHPTLEELFLGDVCGPALSMDQSQTMCKSILGIKNKLVKLGVEQGNDDEMHQYTFDGLWEMLSRHESINNIYFYHHSRMWTENHIAKVCTAIRSNPRIVQIDEDSLVVSYQNRHMIGQWNRDVKPLLKMNQLQIRITELMSHQLLDDSTRRAWLELLVAESNSFAGLYQILRGTVDMLADVLECCIVVTNNRKRARESME